jgi:rhodanese-related sulfurtransferase
MFISAHELVLDAKKYVKEYQCDQIHEKLTSAKPLIIDVREPDEYLQGHIAGSVNIPRGMLEFRISNEPSLQELKRPIVIYCKTSGRAALAVVALQAMGFENVMSLSGGFDAWIAEGRPVSKPRDISYE